MIIKRDCKFFRGDIPCKPHKDFGVHCEECQFYEPKSSIILIIKTGAVGDVIRTTTLLRRIIKEYPDSLIWWVTYTPEVLPSVVDKKLKLNVESLLVLDATEFELVINLDKDDFACGLMNRLKSKKKIGYYLKDGKPAALHKEAEYKYLTGLFDDVNKANVKSYPEEIFEICGWEFDKEEYILDVDESIKWDIPNEGRNIIGLNTGCGGRWISRLWSEDNWMQLALMLKDRGYFPMFLGGEQEHDKNLRMSEATGCYYPGHFRLQEFISLVNQCDAVVSAVTMAMHIAIGLKKPLILMNNIFNKNEFELYGRGEIIEPDRECKCFFSPRCKNDEYFCMEHLPPKKIFNAILRIFN